MESSSGLCRTGEEILCLKRIQLILCNVKGFPLFVLNPSWLNFSTICWSVIVRANSLTLQTTSSECFHLSLTGRGIGTSRTSTAPPCQQICKVALCSPFNFLRVISFMRRRKIRLRSLEDVDRAFHRRGKSLAKAKRFSFCPFVVVRIF